PQREHRDDEAETSVEDARCRFVLRWWRWDRSCLFAAGKLLMQFRLNAVEPMANLNAVVASNIKQHEAGRSGALNHQLNVNLCSGSDRLNAQVCHSRVRETRSFCGEPLSGFSHGPTERLAHLLSRRSQYFGARCGKAPLLRKVLVFQIHKCRILITQAPMSIHL